tara:strand:- start:269 stop:937 length:669 start_codon:yes stop_codon:yes gene_type:complete
MSNNLTMNYQIKDVEAMWPRINRTYKYDSTEQRSIPCNPTDEGSAYTLQFRMSEIQAKELYKQMKIAYDSKKESNWPDKFAMPFKKEEDGTYTHKAKLKGAYGNEATRKPIHYDAKGVKLPDDFMLTNGSLVNVAVVCVPYNMRDNGVSLRLRAVQVVNLKPMKDDNPFTAVDGFEAKEADENPFEDDAPIEEPKKVATKPTPEPKKGGDDLASLVDNWDDD